MQNRGFIAINRMKPLFCIATVQVEIVFVWSCDIVCYISKSIKPFPKKIYFINVEKYKKYSETGVWTVSEPLRTGAEKEKGVDKAERIRYDTLMI